MDSKLPDGREWAEEKPDDVIEKLEIAKQELDDSFKGRLTRRMQPLVHKGDEVVRGAYDRLVDLGAALSSKIERARAWLARKRQSKNEEDRR